MRKRRTWKIEVNSDECPHASGRTCYAVGTANEGKLCRETKCPYRVSGKCLEIKNELQDMLDFHNLEFANVKSIEQNCGTMWIEMNDGSLYALGLTKCESD